MRENSKTFSEILEEKLDVTNSGTNESSTHRAKNSQFVNEKVEFHISLALEKIFFRPKQAYPHSQISIQTHLEKWLSKCKNEQQKASVMFFYNLGAKEFLIGESEKWVTKSYRKLAKELHPDKFAQKDIKTIEKQKTKFIELQNHYYILKTLAKSL